MIEFVEVDSGRVLGTADVQRGEVLLTGVAVSIRGTRRNRDATPEQFVERYSDWSNGYVLARCT